ncbi:MAG: DNA repair protein RadA, partial [Nitrospira sp.]|nr:DNA repair protein RadA [Nitrospira sp.]
MPKAKTVFFCQNCGSQAPKWLGRCPDCGQYNTFVEEKLEPQARSGLSPIEGPRSIPRRVEEIEDVWEGTRLSTAIREFDRVLGGGVVPGATVLIGGDPGIGKSTLLLQALYQIARQNKKVLYVSGEESQHQIKLRSRRLGIRADLLYILSETELEQILNHIKQISPVCVVMDSIQTVFTSQLASAPGSVSQIRESAARLIYHTKKAHIPLFLVGHVTKDGTIAGPRVLEHMVDTVLYFEGEAGSPYRIIRGIKNRFGSTHEIGVFEMREGGVHEVLNPSELFLSERPKGASGSVVVSSLEGSRPILVELQALVSPTHFGLPRRMAVGVDLNRLLLLLAVLEKRGGMPLGSQDVYINVAGGLRINEPALDLGIALAVASSLGEYPLDPDMMVLGEVGLSGEIRAVAQA